MEKQKKLGMNIVQGILAIMLACAFLFFILGEMLLPAENVSGSDNCKIFQADWMRIMPDGIRVPVEVPGECEAERGELVTIITVLPEEQEDTWFCIRSLQQELNIYVGDELRKEYSTLATQPFGKTSTMNYVFFEVNSTDAGSELRIELKSDSAYAGSVSSIYIGEKAEIWKHLLKMYAPATIMAAFMLILSIVVVCYSQILRIFYKRDMEIAYLGNAILVSSAWLLAESRLRQFLLPNSTVAMNMGFLMIMLLPYPFLSYLNRIQKHRYQTAYMAIEICAVVNFVVCVAMQVMNIKDFFETMIISHCILVFMILLMTITLVTDIKRGYVKEYKEVAVGFGVLMLAGIWEIYMVYVNSSQYNGIPMCVGLVVLLFTAGMKTGRDMIDGEREKQLAILASESKAKFLANMSHEIRTPINTVIGMNEMILRENKDKTIQEYAFNIKSASQMLLGLINDVLDFSKIEAGKLQITENNYYLSSMLYDVILGIEVRAKQKNLELKLDIDEGMPTVLKGDEIRIKQIMNNLLSNAVKYTDKGNVTFSAKGVRNEKGFVLELSVADTGIGIRKEDMERLFDSFIRLELKKNRYIEGTGLGLSITKQLVDHMNGSIDVTSEYGKGSCFVVRLPQEIVDETAMGRLGRNIAETGNELKDGDCEYSGIYAPDARILAVDDNRMNLEVIKGLLKKSKIQLDFATGGKECLALTRNKKYDLILMDHMMPEPDGVETLHMLRNEQDNPNRDTEVIVLTANAIAGVEERYVNEGFAGYLSKPLEPVKLEKVIGKHLFTKNLLKKQTVEALDRSLGLIYSGGKEELYMKMQELYMKQGLEYLEKLPQYYKQQNWKEYAVIAHAIKSTSLTIGAKTFSEKAKQHEKAAKEENMEFLEREYEAFIEEYRAVLECVEQEFAKNTREN